MTLHIDFAPPTEAWINAEARQRGLSPIDIVRKLVEERAAASAPATTSADAKEIDAENASAIALLNRWIEEDATDDPEEIRDADDEVTDFKRHLNANRATTGERQVFA